MVACVLISCQFVRRLSGPGTVFYVVCLCCYDIMFLLSVVYAVPSGWGVDLSDYVVILSPKGMSAHLLDIAVVCPALCAMCNV